MSEPLARSVLDSGEIVEEHPYVDPIDLFAEFASQPHSLLLHASNAAVAASGAEESRYSFIAVEPYKTVTAKNGATEISGEAVDGDAFDVLANCLKLEGYKANQDRRAGQDVPPFRGGAAGVFGYDLARSLERLPPQQAPYALDTLYVPDMSIGLYDTVVAIDHRERRTLVIASTHREAPKSLPEPDPETGLQRWRARIGAVRALPDPYLPGGHASVLPLGDGRDRHL